MPDLTKYPLLSSKGTTWFSDFSLTEDSTDVKCTLHKSKYSRLNKPTVHHPYLYRSYLNMFEVPYTFVNCLVELNGNRNVSIKLLVSNVRS